MLKTEWSLMMFGWESSWRNLISRRESWEMPHSATSGPTLIFFIATSEVGSETRWAEKTSAY